jgi:hypothetical protein
MRFEVSTAVKAWIVFLVGYDIVFTRNQKAICLKYVFAEIASDCSQLRKSRSTYHHTSCLYACFVSRIYNLILILRAFCVYTIDYMFAKVYSYYYRCTISATLHYKLQIIHTYTHTHTLHRVQNEHYQT